MKTEKDYSRYLIVRTDMPGLQYNINAILKAFFPDREVRVIADGEPVHDPKLLELPVFMRCVNGMVLLTYFDSEISSGLSDPKYVDRTVPLTHLYDLLCELTGRTLPWGDLTGVRPTKLAMTGLRAGADDKEILDYMQGYHHVSEEKAMLALDIARRESQILSGIDHKNGYSLYIDIPFCPTTCLYCSFTSYSYAAWRDRIDEYLGALFREIDYAAEEISRIPDTVYIGGGTPTSLEAEQLEKLLKYVTDRIDVKKAMEFTCEAGRPDSITREKLEIMKRYGVTRISVNPQTMQQKTLDIIGRRTNPEQVRAAFGLARETGFDNINMDIILGLPGEGEEEVGDTLRQIEDMGPDALTVHSLAVKRASGLREHLDEIGIEALKNTDETMRLAAGSADRMGMKPYYLYRQKNMSGNFENTGYSIPGREGIYNILIMEEVQSIVALGAGAISKRVDYPETGNNMASEEDEYSENERTAVNITRCENPKDIDNYISRIDELILRKKKLYSQ